MNQIRGTLNVMHFGVIIIIIIIIIIIKCALKHLGIVAIDAS